VIRASVPGRAGFHGNAFAPLASGILNSLLENDNQTLERTERNEFRSTILNLPLKDDNQTAHTHKRSFRYRSAQEKAILHKVRYPHLLDTHYTGSSFSSAAGIRPTLLRLATRIGRNGLGYQAQ
jgi:hypothetical protein